MVTPTAVAGGKDYFSFDTQILVDFSESRLKNEKFFRPGLALE